MQTIQVFAVVFIVLSCCKSQNSSSLSNDTTSYSFETTTVTLNSITSPESSNATPESSSETSTNGFSSEASNRISVTTTSSESETPTTRLTTRSAPTHPVRESTSETSARTTSSQTTDTTQPPEVTSSASEHVPRTEEVRIRCPSGSLNEFGTEGRNESGNCFDALGCFNVGLHKNKSLRLEVTCVSRDNKRREGGRCCYRDTSRDCSQGVVALPIEPCETLDDCNLVGHRTTERWCDPMRKQCCRNEFNETRMRCPDRVTALMNEPRCEGFEEGVESSGKCPFPNAVCFHGHCCPRPKIRKPIPGTPYQTQHKCSNLTHVSTRHRFGYCDPDSGTVWIMSTMNFHGQPNKELPFPCLNSRDCWQKYEKDNVCVRISNWESLCYVNPKNEYYVPKKLNLFFVSTFSYVALGASLLSLAFSILYNFWIRETKESSETLEPLIPEN